MQGRFDGRGQRRAGTDGFGWAYLPPYYPDDGTGYWPPAQPQFIPYPVAIQQPQPAPEAKPVEPLMIEERDGQWVRVQDGSDLPSAPQTASASSQAANQSPPKLPSAVIVFRDGHQEEVAKYTIQGNVVYANADYWSTGTWTRKIPLSDLDVPATLKLNQERGTKFTLPSSPNEIMVRF